MRVLLIGPTWDTGQWTEYCERGLRANGHDVVSWRYSADLDRPMKFRDRIRRRLQGPDRYLVGRVIDAMRHDNLRALDLARLHHPQLVVVLKGEPLLPETVDRLRGLVDGPLVQWCGDNPSWFPNIVAAAHLYDRFFLAEPTYAAELLLHGVNAEYLPHAVDPSAWPEISSDVREGPDVIFVGDARHNMGHLAANRDRVEALEQVARMGVSLEVWGRGWEKLEDGYAVRNSHRGLTLLPASAVALAYRRARIVLNVHHAQMREGVNMRTFEIPACGAFQLSDYKACMEELFSVGREIAVFRNPTELAEQIRYYLERPIERRMIAAAGRQRVLHHHTYQVRMRELVQRAGIR